MLGSIGSIGKLKQRMRRAYLGNWQTEVVQLQNRTAVRSQVIGIKRMVMNAYD